MKKYFILLSFVISLLILPGLSYANGIQIISTDTTVQNIVEINEIRGDDLYSEISFEIVVNPKINFVSNYSYLEFKPWYHEDHDVPRIIISELCESASGGSYGYTLGSTEINCKQNIENFMTSIKDEYSDFYIYRIEIPVENLKIPKYFKIKFVLVTEDFVLTEGSNYILGFQSTCNPNDRCNIDSWRKNILFPSKTSVIEDLGNSKIIGRSGDDKWILSISGGDTSFIRYYDSLNREFLSPLSFTVLSIILGAIASTGIFILIDQIKKPKLIFGNIDILSTGNEKFFRIVVKNSPLSEKIKVKGEPVIDCTGRIEVINSKNEIVQNVEGLKWASKGEPKIINWDVIEKLSKTKSKKRAKYLADKIITTQPYLMDETKKETIYSGSKKVLDFIWKSGGEKICKVRTPENYLKFAHSIGLGEYRINLYVIDEKGHSARKSFKLINKGSSLESTYVVE